MGRQLKPWDQYVQEAQADREPLELPLPDGDPVFIHFPTGAQIEQFETALTSTQAILALFGPDDGQRILTLFRQAPFDVFARIVDDIATEFGLKTIMGNRSPSSN